MASKLLGQTKGITVVKKEEEEAGTATDALNTSSSDEKQEFSDDSDVQEVTE